MAPIADDERNHGDQERSATPSSHARASLRALAFFLAFCSLHRFRDKFIAAGEEGIKKKEKGHHTPMRNPKAACFCVEQARRRLHIQHRTQNPVQVSREDYRLQHAYPLQRGGVGSAGGAHEMNKQALGSQPPPTRWAVPGPGSLAPGTGSPPSSLLSLSTPAPCTWVRPTTRPGSLSRGLHSLLTHKQHHHRYRWGPSKWALGADAVLAVLGPPAMGRPPPLAQAAQLALSPLGTPPAGYPAPQHMSQQPIILGNCMPYSQRPGQFSPAPQFVYHQPTYLPAQPATQMFYNTQGMVSVSLPASGGPPQVQAPRGQQAYQQGASQLQPRPRCIIEIKDPVTGRNVLEDLKSTPDETAPEQSSGASDIAGVFAAQVAAVAAASSSGPPPTKVSLPPVLEPPPPPPLVEEVSPHEEEVTAPVEERRETRASPTPPPTVASTALPTELRGVEVAPTQVVSSEPAEPSLAPYGSADVEAPLPTGDAESAVLAEEVVDTQNNADASTEGRTPVVVEDVAPAAVVTRAAKKDAEETPAVPSKTPTSVAPSAPPTEAVRETTDGECLLLLHQKAGLRVAYGMVKGKRTKKGGDCCTCRSRGASRAEGYPPRAAARSPPGYRGAAGGGYAAGRPRLQRPSTPPSRPSHALALRRLLRPRIPQCAPADLPPPV
ncbi:hypothetical protein MRX96_028655 [Rhipicephalus microplus]